LYEDENNQRTQVRDRKAMRGSPIAKELQNAFFYEGADEEGDAARKQQGMTDPAQQQRGQSMAAPLISKYASFPVRVPAPK
jgi:hypothetical protein